MKMFNTCNENICMVQIDICCKRLPKMLQIPFVFAFEHNQPDGNSVDFEKKINIYNFYVNH